MSSDKSEVATQRADESVQEKDKASGDAKSDTSPHKRSASEVNDDGDVKQKIQKTDHKGSEKDKENGESEEKFDDADDADDDDDVVPEGDDYEEDGDEDGDVAEEDGDDDDDDA